MFTLVLLAAGAPGPFVVENKTPPAFKVESKLPAAVPRCPCNPTGSCGNRSCPDCECPRVVAAPAKKVNRLFTFADGRSFWYTQKPDGGWTWCDECNGVTHAEFVRRAARAYLPGCASGNCGR
jgi:hypothetical protein